MRLILIRTFIRCLSPARGATYSRAFLAIKADTVIIADCPGIAGLRGLWCQHGSVQNQRPSLQLLRWCVSALFGKGIHRSRYDFVTSSFPSPAKKKKSLLSSLVTMVTIVSAAWFCSLLHVVNVCILLFWHIQFPILMLRAPCAPKRLCRRRTRVCFPLIVSWFFGFNAMHVGCSCSSSGN